MQQHSKGKAAHVSVCKVAIETCNSLKAQIQKISLNKVIYKIVSLKALWSLSWFHLGNCWNFQFLYKPLENPICLTAESFMRGRKMQKDVIKNLVDKLQSTIMTHKSVNKKKALKRSSQRKTNRKNQQDNSTIK